MIKKLRKKFILINMVLVSLVLLIVFAALTFSTLGQARTQTQDALNRALMDSEGGQGSKPKIGPSGRRESMSTVPAFTVTVDNSGTIISTELDRVEVDADVLDSAVRQVLDSGAAQGSLSSLDLNYLVRNTKGGTRIAFADTSSEKAALTRWLVSALLVGAGGLAAFFFISLFLANWALKPVAAAWEQQRQFVADASHELKTPLTVILANVGILLRHPEATVAQQEKWVRYTEDEAERMKGLVDQMLFLAKTDAARTPTDFKPVNFSDIVWNVVLPFESVAFEKHVTLENQIVPDLITAGDEGQLKQLVAILLDNACKYAGEGGKVNAVLDKVQDRIRLSVHNTGAPILPDQLPRIFERFYRGDKAREQGGYGLGLAIAKTIAETHRGRIKAESSEAAGTTFTVTLPLKEK